MRVLAFALLAVSAASAAVIPDISEHVPEEPIGPCEPGKSFKHYCNGCRCGADGITAACTIMRCPPGVYNRDGSLKSSAQVPNRQRRQVSSEQVSDSPSGPCEPGKSFKHYCNSCTCSADGTAAACTMMLCPEGLYNRDGSLKSSAQVPDSGLVRKTRQVSHNRPCEAGKPFKIYCNTCACGSDGFSVSCTRMECPPGVYNEDGSLKSSAQVPDSSLVRHTRQTHQRVKCEPGKPVNIYCNTCGCGSDGLSTVCTKMACPEGMFNLDGSLTSAGQRELEAAQSEQVSGSSLARHTRQVSPVNCEPGKPVKMFCNTCFCGSDGLLTSCTRMACPPGMYNLDGSLTSAGQSGQVPDSSLVRHTRQINLRVKCEPGKPLKIYCNTCGCGPDGLSTVCTRKACPEGMYNLDGSLTSAGQSGQVPDNTLVRQTRQINLRVKCEPGKPLKIYCNTCGCGPDGLSTVCTRKACPEGMYNLDGSLTSAGQSGQVPDNSLVRHTRQVGLRVSCEPGKPVNVYCNKCACGPDGVATACTRMACPDGMYNLDGSLTSAGQSAQVPDNSLVRHTRQVGLRVSCEPGKPVNVYCNKCACGPDGLATACTRMACPDGMYNLDGSLTSAGQSAQVPDNSLIRETRQVSHNRPCEAGKSFKLYCNTCACGSDGFSVSCTRMACPEGVYNEDGSRKNPQQVPDNASMAQYEPSLPDVRCEPGKSFKHYCNTCMCGANGTPSGCTLMMCPPDVFNRDGSLKSSAQVSDRQRREVSTEQVSDSPSGPCEPGKSFKHYCNSCTCAADGSGAACTLMMCPEGVYNRDGSLKSSAQVSDRQRREVSTEQVSDSPSGPCEPGKSFKHYCNSCTCAADGSGAACTLMMCPEGVYNRDGSPKSSAQVPDSSLVRKPLALRA